MYRLLNILATCLILAACAGPPLTPTLAPPTAIPPTISSPSATPLSPTPSPTVEPTPTPTPTPPRLPAPLYFIGQDWQIWRLDATGLTRLTAEPGRVTEFDLSPADGSLVYVSDNDLVRASADGSQREVLVDGPALSAEADETWNWTLIQHPQWSPDGTQIAYGLDGLYVIPAPGAEPTRLADDLHDMDVADDGLMALFTDPVDWSPDGLRLLVEVGTIPASTSHAVYSFATGSLIVMRLPGDLPSCCEATWSLDGQSVYIASNIRLGAQPGLWRFDLATAITTPLIAGESDGEYRYVTGVRQLADGLLYFFMAVEGSEGVAGTAHRMYRADPADLSQMKALRDDTYGVREALWAEDGSGTVIVDAWPPDADCVSIVGCLGPLIWLPADGGPAVPLGVSGRNLRWGR